MEYMNVIQSGVLGHVVYELLKYKLSLTFNTFKSGMKGQGQAWLLDEQGTEKILARASELYQSNQDFEQYHQIIQQDAILAELLLVESSLVKKGLNIPESTGALIGRDDIIKNVTLTLTGESCLVLLVAIDGLGKTAISRAIAYNLLQENVVQQVVWLNGAQGLLHAAREAAVAYQLNVDTLGWEYDFISLLSNLPHPSVLIIDNLLSTCIDTELFNSLTSCPITILANSQSTQTLFTDVIEVDFLSTEACVQLFNTHTTYRDNSGALSELIELSGRHPLTIELLAKMVESTLTTLPDLLSQIKQTGFDLSQLPNTLMHAELNSVVHDNTCTLDVAQHVEKLFAISGLNENQQRILRLMAILPFSQYQGANDLVPWLTLESEAFLVQLSILGWLQHKGDCFSIHPIIANAALQHQAPRTNELEALTKIIISHAQPDVIEHWSEQLRYLPVLLAIYKVVGQGTLEIDLLQTIAKLHETTVANEAALPLYQRDLEIKETTFGKDHLEVATTLDNLARLSQKMVEYEEAVLLYERSLKIKEKTLGTEHLEIATTLDNLARSYECVGRSEEALFLYEHSLEIKEKALGKEHPEVAAMFNDLVRLYRSMRKYEKALPFYLRDLEMGEKDFGKDHPNVAYSLHNLAELYQTMGAYEEALPLYQRSLDIKETTFGKDHYNMANTLHDLAGLYQAMGIYEEALTLYQRSLYIQETELGKDHPSLENPLYSLKELYQDMGAYEEALLLCQRDLEIKEKTLGKDHLNVASTLHNLAALHQATGKSKEALALYQRSLEISEATWGKDDPYMVSTVHNLAELYKDMGMYEKASPLYNRALSIQEADLGEDHPEVAIILRNLAGLYQAVGAYEESLPLYQRSLKIKEIALGKNHFEVAITLHKSSGNVSGNGSV